MVLAIRATVAGMRTQLGSESAHYLVLGSPTAVTRERFRPAHPARFVAKGGGQVTPLLRVALVERPGNAQSRQHGNGHRKVNQRQAASMSVRGDNVGTRPVAG